MADAALVTQPQNGPEPQPDTALIGGAARDRLAGFITQPAIKRSLPLIIGTAALGLVAMLYLSMANGPQRILYSSLSDNERGQVVAALESGGIAYSIDNGTGALTVAEDEIYRARMLVASNGALSVPDSGGAMLDAIPLGASRTLEGERLKLARERELMLTIMEIDGIESVRVHLATPEKSVFVREKVAPSASVMVRLARGRSLQSDQVDAIINLVAASVPGMDSGDVRVADQNGDLLSDNNEDSQSGLHLQQEFEVKLQGQLAKLLVPILGEGNFSSEVQVELNMDESTSARETYDKDGVVRNESESRSERSSPQQAAGVPGALSNTPPPPAELVEGAPQATAIAQSSAGGDSESSAKRNYALDREVAVNSTQPGGLARISVAVAVDQAALKKIAPANEAKLQSLIEAAVGANPDRGDKVTVIVGKFEPASVEEIPFYEASWFAMALRYGAALLAVLLVMLLAVRPLLALLRGDRKEADAPDDDSGEEIDPETGEALPISQAESGAESANPLNLREQVALARRLANEQPERAVSVLQRMLDAPAQSRQI